MKLTKLTLLPLFIAGITNTVSASVDAEALFDSKCAMCHIKTMPTDRASMIAPAVFGVMRHVKMSYPKKEDAVKFMVDYVLSPSKEKAICMPQKIARFGLMPSQKGTISEEELKKVSEWMFDNYPPANFRGRGQGMQCRGNQGRPSFADFDDNGDGMISKEEFDAFRANRMKKRMNP